MIAAPWQSYFSVLAACSQLHLCLENLLRRKLMGRRRRRGEMKRKRVSS